MESLSNIPSSVLSRTLFSCVILLRKSLFLLLYFPGVSFFKKNLYFIIDAITVVPIFLSMPPSTQSHPYSLRQSPYHCPFFLHICSLATMFPMLYFTSPWLFCNYHFILLNPFTFFTHPPDPLPSANHQNIFCVYDSVSGLFMYFVF